MAAFSTLLYQNISGEDAQRPLLPDAGSPPSLLQGDPTGRRQQKLPCVRGDRSITLIRNLFYLAGGSCWIQSNSMQYHTMPCNTMESIKIRFLVFLGPKTGSCSPPGACSAT